MVTLPANFRDLGGITCSGGKKVRPGMLLRSGELDELTQEEQKAFIDEYNIGAIVDFRFEDEVTLSGYPWRGIPTHNIDLLKNAADYVPGFNAFHSIEDIGRVRTFMCEVYEMLITDPFAREGMRRFLDIALERNEKVLLFHCFAGKDRTGLAAAVLLSILGASEEEIFKDYMKTNELRAESNEKMLEKDRMNGLSEAKLKVSQSFLLVREDYLKTAFETAEKQFGGFAGYIEDALNVTPQEARIFKNRYLE